MNTVKTIPVPVLQRPSGGASRFHRCTGFLNAVPILEHRQFGQHNFYQNETPYAISSAISHTTWYSKHTMRACDITMLSSYVMTYDVVCDVAHKMVQQTYDESIRHRML